MFIFDSHNFTKFAFFGSPLNIRTAFSVKMLLIKSLFDNFLERFKKLSQNLSVN